MTPADLASLTLQSPMPVTLTLQVEAGGAHEYVFRELLRVLPGRRVVARAWDGEREVVLKLFLGSRRDHYRDRESAGLERLKSAGARTPEMLAQVRGPELLGLVMRYLSDSELVDAGEQHQVAALVVLLAELHQQGLRQKDLHLDNFLRHQGHLYAIDGDGVQRSRRPLGRRTSVQNFAVLLAQLPPVTESWVDALSAAYRDARGWSDDLAQEVHEQLARERGRRASRYLRKTLRNCTEFVVRSEWRQKLSALRGLDPDLVARAFVVE